MSRLLGWQVNERGAAGLWLNMPSEKSDNTTLASPTAAVPGCTSERVHQGQLTVSECLTVLS